MLRYREYAPPAALSEWVECLWTGETDRPVLQSPVRPDGCMDIVYSPAQGLRVVGAMTIVQRHDHLPGDFHCGVRFRPGMAREFLGTPAGELTDRNIALVSPLAHRLEDSETAEESVRALAAHLQAPRSAKRPIQRAIAAITIRNGRADLDRIASDANLSVRHFRRLCLDESGLSPKHLCRVLRFRRALLLAQCKTPDWADIAADAGYFDQSHLIREFREFTGETPMAVLSNRAADVFR